MASEGASRLASELDGCRRELFSIPEETLTRCPQGEDFGKVMDRPEKS